LTPYRLFQHLFDFAGGRGSGWSEWVSPRNCRKLYLFRTAFDEAGTPVEVCEHVMSGDRWLLTYEWAAD
jgi:hypothetical protein